MLHLFPESTWRPPNLDTLPQDWNAFKRVAIDTETRDDQLRELGPGVRRGGYIAGISLAWEDGPEAYLPFAHDGGDNLDPAQVLAYVRRCAKNYQGILVGANLPYDLDFLEEAKITFPGVAYFRDVLVAEPLLDEHQHSYSLENVAQRRLGTGKDEGLLEQAALAFCVKDKKANPKSQIWKLPARYVGSYATRDATLPLHLLRVQEREIEAQDLTQVWDLESRVVPVVTNMRRRGLRVDEARLDYIAAWAIEQETAALAEVQRTTGVKIAFGQSMNPALCAEVLRAIGVESRVDLRGRYSITKDDLDGLHHPVADGLRRARKMMKLRTTYVSGVREQITNGRVHCTFNQLRASKDDGGEKGTITGRVSADNPNLLNQPVRDPEIGPLWLSIYIPEEGRLWALPDFSQIEPRWLVEWSILAGPARIGQRAWEAATAFAQRYQEDPETDFHVMTTTLSEPGYPTYSKEKQKATRQRYKQIGLGNIYGKGGLKLCRELELPTVFKTIDYGSRKGQRIECAGPEGQDLMDRFDRGVPFARAMLKADIKQAKALGFVRTWSKRRSRFERDLDGNVIDPHKGLNKRIQGSSADQTKTAMIELERAGFYLQLQIYDSLGASVETEAQGREICEIMENCIPMRVAVRADLKVGKNWGELA